MESSDIDYVMTYGVAQSICSIEKLLPFLSTVPSDPFLDPLDLQTQPSQFLSPHHLMLV